MAVVRRWEIDLFQADSTVTPDVDDLDPLIVDDDTVEESNGSDENDSLIAFTRLSKMKRIRGNKAIKSVSGLTDC